MRDLMPGAGLDRLQVFGFRPVQVRDEDGEDPGDRRGIPLDGELQKIDVIAGRKLVQRGRHLRGHHHELAQGAPAQEDHGAGHEGKEEEQDHERSAFHKKIEGVGDEWCH
jgi:hypothetical protein